MHPARRVAPQPNQESVWDYPRPPRLEPFDERIRVIFAGRAVADTQNALRVLETSHPPVYYIPRNDVLPGVLKPFPGESFCEFKGRAVYWSLIVDGRHAKRAAWSFSAPTKPYCRLKDHLAFYPSRVDFCLVGDEPARAQEGDFYGGWITANIVGPFKGGPGTLGW